MNTDWNNKEQLERFLTLQRKKPEMPVQHTRELWDRWAHNWESGLREDEARKERSRKRITATAEFLRSHGLLGADCEVIDIGCGPGRFVAEFAKTAKYVTGTDLSPNMLDYAQDSRFSSEKSGFQRRTALSFPKRLYMAALECRGKNRPFLLRNDAG